MGIGFAYVLTRLTSLPCFAVNNPRASLIGGSLRVEVCPRRMRGMRFALLQIFVSELT
jgi:hypothetical protein